VNYLYGYFSNKVRNKRFTRLIVRLSFFAAACAFLWPILSYTDALKHIFQASPFVAICSSVSSRRLETGALVGFAFAFVTIIKRRWFCGYVCPTGLLLEGVARIGLAKTSWWGKCPPIGRYAAILTFFGAVAGYPFLLWMDPLALFGGFLTVRTAGTVLSGFLAGSGLGFLIILSLISEQFWCKRLCPLGGAQDLLASARSIFRKPIRIIQGGSSEKEIIPLKRALLIGSAGIVLALLSRKIGAARGEDAPLRPPGAVEEDIFTGLCVRCGNCARVCPSKIIIPDSGQAGVWGFLAPVIGYEKEYCREDCVACTQVCPSGALQPLDLERKRRYVIGEALVDGSLCLTTLAKKDCDACAGACPFNAVHIHWDEDLYVAYPLINVDKCNGCGACETVCPIAGFKAIRVWKTAPDNRA